MPLPDNVWDRLKGALVPTSAGADNGAPGMIVADPSGFCVPGVSAANAAQTITHLPDANEQDKATGFEVSFSGPGVVTEVTLSLLGSGAAVLWQGVSPSGSNVPVARDFDQPIDAGLAATLQLYVGPGGASIRTYANLRGYTVGGV